MATNTEERKARIAAARQGSLRLMQMDANGTLDKLMEGRADEINNSLTSADANVTSDSLISSKREDRMNRMPTGRMSVAAANVPSIIRESFQAQPPAGDNMTTSSVLDDMFGNMITEQTVTEPVMKKQQSQQVFTTGTGGVVDYPMIRTIVEDIVRKYSQSLKKNLLTENTNGAEINTIALGKTFKFLDNKGNIYECTMKKVGNINKKKSVNE